MFKIKLFFIVGVTVIFSLKSQEKETKKWDVSNPKGEWNFKELKLKTDEGTWMNLDVSPNGKEIVFDLLGDIYKMPVTGGTATLLREGLPFEIQPRFSPNGNRILFTSDAGGGDNIWVMKADGSEAKQITKESFRLLNNGVWSADGNYFYCTKALYLESFYRSWRNVDVSYHWWFRNSNHQAEK